MDGGDEFYLAVEADDVFIFKRDEFLLSCNFSDQSVSLLQQI